MQSLLRATLLIALVLLVPVIPFLLLGGSFEERVVGWFQQDLSAAARFGLIVGLLATDVFLPVPSSIVSTYGGGVLGTWPATAASSLGMTLGAVLGFVLARVFGVSFAARFAGERELEQMAGLSRRYGPVTLVLTRALPILAEACVLLMGTTHLSWKRFLIPVVAANFVISLTYAAFGAYFEGRDAFPVAVVSSGAIPLLMAVIVRRWLPAMRLEDASAEGNAP